MIPGNPAFGATVLRLAAEQSPNYVAGVSGWFIGADGSAEFNDATFRGEVIATEFAATIVVALGPYSGTYLIQTAEFTDSNGNHLAVIQWLNETNPATEAPYLACATGPGSGALAALHSGQEDGSDSESALYLLSAEASTLGDTTAILDTTYFQPFGGSGPTIFEDDAGTGLAVDTWQAITLDSGWTAGAQPPQFRLLPDGNVQVRGQATHAGVTAATNINGSHPIPSNYWPGETRIYRPPDAGDAAATVDITTVGIFVARASGFTATAVAMDGIYSI